MLWNIFYVLATSKNIIHQQQEQHPPKKIKAHPLKFVIFGYFFSFSLMLNLCENDIAINAWCILENMYNLTYICGVFIYFLCYWCDAALKHKIQQQQQKKTNTIHFKFIIHVLCCKKEIQSFSVAVVVRHRIVKLSSNIA